MKDVYIKESDDFYKKIKKYINQDKVRVHFLYEEEDIIDDTYIKENDCSDAIKEKIYFIHAINVKDTEKRYSYIYDIVCAFLDKEFENKNICGFDNNICLSVKNKSHCSESKNGCCYGTKRGLCKHFKDNKCEIKSLSCKLFTCRYLKKQKVKYRVGDIPLLKYFFNIKQKFILDSSIFKDKEEIIELLMKSR